MPSRTIPAMTATTQAYCSASSFSFRKMRERITDTMQYYATICAATTGLRDMANT